MREDALGKSNIRADIKTHFLNKTKSTALLSSKDVIQFCFMSLVEVITFVNRITLNPACKGTREGTKIFLLQKGPFCAGTWNVDLQDSRSQ